MPASSSSEHWETLSEEDCFSTNHLTVVAETVRVPGQNDPVPWTTVRRKKAVVIAAMTSDDKFVLVRQRRIPIRETIWEMPAGQVDANSPSRSLIEETALKELGEETGYVLGSGGELIALGDFFSSPGMTNENCYFFLARPVVRDAQVKAHDEHLILEERLFTGTELCRMIAENEIRDANTLSISARMAARGFLHLGPPEK